VIELTNLGIASLRAEHTRDVDVLELKRRRYQQKYIQLVDTQQAAFTTGAFGILANMKFSHSVQFNAVPDWSSHYIAYSNLKKLIYTCEKTINQRQYGGQAPDAEQSPLLPDADSDPPAVFRRALDAELEKIVSFYQIKEREIYEEVDALLSDTDEYLHDVRQNGGVHPEDGEVSAAVGRHTRKRKNSLFGDMGFGGGNKKTKDLGASTNTFNTIDDEEEDSDDDVDEGTALRSKPPKAKSASDEPSSPSATRRRSSIPFKDFDNPAADSMYDPSMTLKKRLISVYVTLCELKSYAQLNKTGFRKVLKKFDKVLDQNLRQDYMKKEVEPAYAFQSKTTDSLDEKIRKIEYTYADMFTESDSDLAKRELRLHLREHVVWERNTVWRDMIGIERKAQAANLGIRSTLLGGNEGAEKSQRTGDGPQASTREFNTVFGRLKIPTLLLSSNFILLVAIIAVFAVLLGVPIMEKREQQNCLAMLVFVSLLWATEVIPLFVTSLLVPFLVVILQIARSDNKPHHRLGGEDAAKYIFSAMWTPVIMLLLGGFTIAAALSKYNIAKVMATFVLSKAGTRPRTVLVTNMFVALFASMWISNVAAPVLCFSIIEPILRNLPSDSNFSKALILGIALSSNIGGAASPIASPQNLIALENMQPTPGWLQWFFIALPVCIVTVLLIWVLLLVTFQPGKGTSIVPIKPVKDKFTGTQWFISIVTIATIILWCVAQKLQGIFGDMGVIAIIPMIAFFGTGILTKEDFNNFLWTIIILAAGGLSLGKAVSSSGLLHTLAGAITERVADFSLYGVLVVFAALILVIATFISHTVAALILLPLVKQVGTSMDHPHPNLLVMAGALMCSAAMGLPTSGFPNMTAIMLEDGQTGQRYLRVQHFLTRGVPASLIAFAVVISLGYGLMLVVGL